MKQRERILLISTALVIGVYALDRVGGVDAVVDLVTLNNAQVQALRERNAEYRKQMENVLELQADFERIGRLFKAGRAEGDGRKRDDEFSEFDFTEDLNAICTDLKLKGQQISVARREPIEDVSEYQFLAVELEANRLEEVTFKHLLQRLDEDNIIVQQLDINAIPDTTMVNIDMKLAKIERVKSAALEATN